MTTSCDNGPSLERKPLGWRDSRDGNRLWGWPLIFWGVFVLFVSRTGTDQEGGPKMLPTLFGAFYLCSGAVPLILGFLRGWRLRGLRSQFPTAPWRGDRDWDPAGTDDGLFKRSILCFLGALYVFASLAIPYVGGVPNPYTNSVNLVTLLSGLIGLLCLIAGGMSLRDHFIRGKMFLKFERFPYRLGERMEATLIYPYLYQQCDNFEVILRCVEERTNSESSRG